MIKQTIKKHWGRELILEQNNHYVVKILEINAGCRLSLQYHNQKHETMYCLYGNGSIILGDKTERQPIYAGKTIVIRPGLIHRLQADSESNLAILECSTPELDDVVRLEDDYGRVDRPVKF